MLEPHPLVSIIITSYNRSEWIIDAIESALKQNYSNIEIIISDNCSTDGTKSIVAKYLLNSKIKFYENESNIGMFLNFDNAIKSLANGKYFVILNSDDILINNSFISDCVDLVNLDSKLFLIKSKSAYFTKKSVNFQTYNVGNFYSKVFKSGSEAFLNYTGSEDLSWAGVFVNRNEFLKLNVFNSNNNNTYFDVVSNLQLMILGNVYFFDKISYLIRDHNERLSKQYDSPFMIESLNIILKPYFFAKKYSDIDEFDLEYWKNLCLFNLILSNLLSLYVLNRVEFFLFRKYISSNYNSIYRKILDNRRYKIYVFIFKYRGIFRTYTWIKGLIKN